MAHFVAADEDDADRSGPRCCSRYLPSNNLEERAARPERRGRVSRGGVEFARSRREHQAVRHARGPGRSARRWRVPRGAGRPRRQHPDGFGRIDGRAVGVVANQPAGAGRHARYRRQHQRRPLRPLLRRLQCPADRLRGRARLPARDRPGVSRHHPPRLEAALRLRRGDRAERSRSSPARPTAAPTSS